MGLSNNLNDASSDSIPILFLLSVASLLSHLRSLLHYFGIRPQTSDLAASPLFPAVGSRLASLTLLADHLATNRSFSYGEGEEEEGEEEGCIFCLSRLEKGDQIRRLSCCHVFHSHCLDGWLDRMNLSCPLCRSPLVQERPDLDRRIGTELVAWLSPY